MHEQHYTQKQTLKLSNRCYLCTGAFKDREKFGVQGANVSLSTQEPYQVFIRMTTSGWLAVTAF